MIRTVCLNPCIDKTARIDSFTLDVVNRLSDLRVDAGGKGINVSKVIRELGGTSVAYALLAGAPTSRSSTPSNTPTPTSTSRARS